jgi:hypothetical protein
MNVPLTNLQCQHGISVAQTAWVYENMGYAAAAMNMYQQAVNTLSAGISTLAGPAPDDALFHLGASQLRLGCLCQNLGNSTASRQWIQASLPNLREAWGRFPGNPWYQQALVQASLLLGQLGTAEEVREQSPQSAAVEKISGWIDRAVQARDRLNVSQGGPGRAIASNWAPAGNEWSSVVMRDVFNGSPAWAGAGEW